MSRVIELQRYIGKPVRDADGKDLGHLHEVRARREGAELVVQEFVVGGAGLFERFSVAQLTFEVGFIFGIGRVQGYVVPWDCMQFPEDGKPRCTRRASELKRFSAERPAGR
jgi:hypothetical protein